MYLKITFRFLEAKFLSLLKFAEENSNLVVEVHLVFISRLTLLTNKNTNRVLGWPDTKIGEKVLKKSQITILKPKGKS